MIVIKCTGITCWSNPLECHNHPLGLVQYEGRTPTSWPAILTCAFLWCRTILNSESNQSRVPALTVESDCWECTGELRCLWVLLTLNYKLFGHHMPNTRTYSILVTVGHRLALLRITAVPRWVLPIRSWATSIMCITSAPWLTGQQFHILSRKVPELVKLFIIEQWTVLQLLILSVKGCGIVELLTSL